MTAILTRADSLREYLTGAASDGAAQLDPNLSIGNFCSSLEARSCSLEIEHPILGVVVESFAGGNLEGIGFLKSQITESLSWAAPETNNGADNSITSLSTLILESSNNPGSFLRVRANPPFSVSTSEITGTALFGNVFGLSDVASADASAGVTKYRATILRNDSVGSVTLVKRWIGELGTSRVSNTTQLGASGAGTIVTSGSLADWPASGWCRIVDNGGTLREIVYYTKRTNTTLTVPSGGRARLGTSAGAGAGTDTIHAVPGVAIGLDTNGVQNSGLGILTIANETTAPAGVAWVTGITAATGLNIGTMAASKQIGIWIKREIPASAACSPNLLTRLKTSFTANGVNCETAQLGRYRIQNLSAIGYLVYVGTNALPDLTVDPFAVVTSLPASISRPLPGSGTDVLYVIVRLRNSYGCVSQNQHPYIITLTSSGVVNNEIHAPDSLQAFAKLEGAIRVLALYSTMAMEANPANTIKVWVGTTIPDPDVDAPTYSTALGDSNICVEFGTFTPDTYHVLLRLDRSSDGGKSPVVSTTVVVPGTPSEPEAVFSGYVVLP